MTTRTAEPVGRATSRDLKRHLASLIFAQLEYGEIVNRAWQILGAPVAIWDPCGTLLAAAGLHEGEIATIFASFERVRAGASDAREPYVFGTDVLRDEMIVTPIQDDHGTIAFLFLGRTAAVERADAIALGDQLASVVLFEFLRRRAVRTTEERLSSS